MSTAKPEAPEALRRHYRPASVRLLFVGESPPASGRFFYRGDSGLYRAMLQAFQQVDPSITSENYLQRFQCSGCYLVDLCPKPVDHLEPAARQEACRAAEASLARILRKLQPLVIVTVVRSIEANVLRAAATAGWRGEFLHLPYPGRWARSKTNFSQQLTEYLRRLALGTSRA